MQGLTLTYSWKYLAVRNIRYKIYIETPPFLILCTCVLIYIKTTSCFCPSSNAFTVVPRNLPILCPSWFVIIRKRDIQSLKDLTSPFTAIGRTSTTHVYVTIGECEVHDNYRDIIDPNPHIGECKVPYPGHFSIAIYCPLAFSGKDF